MNTKPFDWMPVPFFNKTKLTQEEKELQKRINLETKDLKRIFYSRWSVFNSPFKKAKLFSFYESTLTQANNHLNNIKDVFQYNVATIEVYRRKLWDFVLPANQSEIIKLNHQRAIERELVKNKKHAVENHGIIIEGTKAQVDINNAHIIALESDSNLKKAQHANWAVDNSAIEIELQKRYKEEVLNRDSQDSVNILSDKKHFESTLPSYPDFKSEPLNPITIQSSFEPKFSSEESSSEEKPTFKGKDKSTVQHYVDYTIVDAPDYFLAESQFLKAQQAYGMQFAKTNFPDNQIEQDTKLSTTSSEALDSPNISETFLGSITRSKVNLTFIIVFLAMIPEYLIYSSIIAAIFEFQGIKAILAGTVVLLFGKANAMIIYNTVLEFFKKQSKVLEFKNAKVNRFFFFLFCISLLYCFAIGLLFKSYKDEQKATKEYVMLQQATIQMQENAELSDSPKTAEFNKELQKAKDEAQRAKAKMLRGSDSPSLLKVLTIGFSGAIVLLFSSCLFAMALIFSTCYHLRRKVEIATKRIMQSEIQFNNQKQSMAVFREKAFHICSLIGELEFLRRLKEGSPKESLYVPRAKENQVTREFNEPLPLVDEQIDSIDKQEV